MAQSDVLNVRVLQIGYDESEPATVCLERAVDLIAQQSDADLIVLPELWLHGAFASGGWATSAVDLDGPVVAALAGAARRAGSHLLAGSVVERAAEGADRGREGRGLWNTAILFDRRGDLVASYRKVHRFGFGEGEPDTVEAGEETVTVDLDDRRGRAMCRIGLAICYDLRFPELFRRLVDDGAEMLIIPAAWPAARVAHWEALGVARAIENQAYVVQCNDGGSHAGHEMGGSSQVVSPVGEVLGRLSRGDGVLSLGLDLRVLREARRVFPVLEDRRFERPALVEANPAV